jgi:hypothetical protein
VVRPAAGSILAFQRRRPFAFRSRSASSRRPGWRLTRVRTREGALRREGGETEKALFEWRPAGELETALFESRPAGELEKGLFERRAAFELETALFEKQDRSRSARLRFAQ